MVGIKFRAKNSSFQKFLLPYEAYHKNIQNHSFQLVPKNRKKEKNSAQTSPSKKPELIVQNALRNDCENS